MSLWLVQTTQTTKSLSALGPALGTPRSHLPKCPQAFKKKNRLWLTFTFYFLFFLPFLPNQLSPLFPVMDMKRCCWCRPDVWSIIMKHTPSCPKYIFLNKYHLVVISFVGYSYRFPPARWKSLCCKHVNVECVDSSDKYYHALDLYWSPSRVYTHSAMLSLNIWSPECFTEWQITSGKSAAITGNNVPISPSPPLYLSSLSPPCPSFPHVLLISTSLSLISH